MEDRLSTSSIGGDDVGGGMRVERWRDLNRAIDEANSLPEIEKRIQEIQVLLGALQDE
jgi:hypothetical protein